MGCCLSTSAEQTTVDIQTTSTSVPTTTDLKKYEHKTEIHQSLEILTSQRLFNSNVDPGIQSLCQQQEQQQEPEKKALLEPEIVSSPLSKIEAPKEQTYPTKIEEQEPEQQTKNEIKPSIERCPDPNVGAPKEQTYQIKVDEPEQQKKSLQGIWNHYATDQYKTKMNMESLTRALVEFGIQIDGDRKLQKLVFNAFDSEQNGEWIDYDDFEATILFFITSNNEGNLLLLFQIFDKNQDGFLEVADVGKIIFSMHCIDSMTIHSENVNNLSNEQCLQIAWNMVQKYIKSNCSPNSPNSAGSLSPNSSNSPDSPNSPYSTTTSTLKTTNFANIKISFKQFKSMMMDENKNDMI